MPIKTKLKRIVSATSKQAKVFMESKTPKMYKRKLRRTNFNK